MIPRLPDSVLRALVLPTAVALALAITLPEWGSSARAEAPETAPSQSPGASSVQAPASAAAASTPGGTPAPASPGQDQQTRATIDIQTPSDEVRPGSETRNGASGKRDRTSSITIEKDGKRVQIIGAEDQDFDPFGAFSKGDRRIAGMAVAIVGIVFLSPVLIVALVVGYRIKKARLANEAMLKLAERGVVPPAEAMQAIAVGTGTVTETALGAAAGERRTLPVRAASSDLRKGVIIGAVGLGLTIYGLATEGSPGAIGLIALFVGAGYMALWWFETRELTARNPESRGPQP